MVSTRGERDARRPARVRALTSRSSGKRSLLCATAAGAIIAGLTARSAVGAPLTVGSPVLNPVTGQNETIVSFLTPSTVLTSADNLILLDTSIGDTFSSPTLAGRSYTITGNTTTTVSVLDNEAVPVAGTLGIVTSEKPLVTPYGGSGGLLSPISPVGNFNYSNIQQGASGAAGNVGLCIPFPIILFLCFPAGAGGNGSPGPDITDNLTGSYQSVSNLMPAAVVASLGGNGGNGGDGVGLLIPGAAGGAAGAGGNVTVTANASFATSGDDSAGLAVQSIAGAGGQGGSGFILSLGGGSGGAAAQGGNVFTSFSGFITTTGTHSAGLLAQSLGGAAGGGGGSYGLVGNPGDGSVGGNGGNVTVHQDGLILTTGLASAGVLAQSIGGPGGDAGTGVGLVTLGASGGGGGDAGAVYIIAGANSATVTEGANSAGLFAQSIGGGGGSGGVGVGLITIGSTGAGGGNASIASIVVDDNALVSTQGDDSNAVFAQSIGGGGGSGGVDVGVLASIGSTGAGGGNGGIVDVGVGSGAFVSTSGARSDAVVAQSIGGGGGSAGVNIGLIVAVGGSGAGGGDGQAVTVGSSGSLDTSGVDSIGVLAQSIGGGGGAAGGAGGLIAIGGSGAGGGSGGDVTVNLTQGGQILTFGDGSDGVLAQSIGGGGGFGGGTGGLVALGSTGNAAGGMGGVVDVSNGGLIATFGSRSTGILAQSIGGGGGGGGDAGGLFAIGGAGGTASTGGAVTVSNTGYIATRGNVSNAIEAESIGGGGGDGGTTGGVFLTIGGVGGAGGDASLVTVNDSGFLSTLGNDSNGIFAQSVGGGGGNGGSTVSISLFVGAAIGGAAGAGGAGGDVNVDFSPSTINFDGASAPTDPVIVTTGDRSDAVFAQSVGGGGGKGGFSIQATVGYDVAIGFSIGGQGGQGGDGGHVSINGDVAILTEGSNSEGVLAQSVGGGGGTGGFAVELAASGGEALAASLSVGVGGSGGGGGAGGAVDVASGGEITTLGNFSTGLVAQSVGGGGGSGGFAASVAIAAAAGSSFAAGVGVGGSGGDGGAGGAVDATFGGSITTRGEDSGGALIQSVGGGGGSGGFALSGSALALAVGGSGGGGGAGGNVTGAIGGEVVTTGDRSTGVDIQSVGGGGGSGGFAVSAGLAVGVDFAAAAAIGVGGAGGEGGAGGNVTASSAGIETFGNQSGGFLAQSVGGGGGSGGFAISGAVTLSAGAAVAASLGVGGAGGGGGVGGSVDANVFGEVDTAGDQSSGIVAQSIGGGGGAGGFAASASVALSMDGSGAISVGVGGSGGGGGSGGDVRLGVADGAGVAAMTLGDQSIGVEAQSVGGGGGNGGFSIVGALSEALDGAGSAGLGVGGFGGAGGVGGAVVGQVTGSILTKGDDSGALLVQSIGGGGGHGGFNLTGGISLSQGVSGNVLVGIGGAGGGGGNGGAVSGFLSGNVETLGDGSFGITYQSLGGGGGAGGFNVTGGLTASVGSGPAGQLDMGFGGFGGAGGTGSTVDATITGDVHTEGNEAHGVLLQSAGGGGGDGGLDLAGGVSFSLESASGTVGIGMGGFGGAGGQSGAVTGAVTGNVLTQGNESFGIALQSLGGGGGSGGLNLTGGVSVSWDSLSGTLGIGMGGFGGGGGNSGDVTGTLVGDVSTHGEESFDAALQSIAGGGGSGGLNLTGALSLSTTSTASVGIGLGGFGGAGGASGNVTGSVTGLYETKGEQSDGVMAQSIAGGGGAGGVNIDGTVALGQQTAVAASIGLGGFGGAGGNAGNVSLTRTGDTVTEGEESDAILAQSVGGGGGAGGVDITGGLSVSATQSAFSVGLGVGGFGGAGGTAGNVSLAVTGNVTALGGAQDNGGDTAHGSDGVVAQSIGGGGGVGGVNITGEVSLGSAGAGSSRTAAIGIGGFGGHGGDAGSVTLTLDGVNSTLANVVAFGDDKAAVLAQSIGGGGGGGGVNLTGGLALDGTLVIGVGGFGADAGRAGDVTATVNANLTAGGERVRGLAAQSIGGGGGQGGVDISGAVTADLSTNEPSIDFGLGGGGGAGSVSGNVTVFQNGQITAAGKGAIGLLAESVAGGGGSGGANISLDLNLGSSVEPTQGIGVAAGIGGIGGSGANAGSVFVDSTGLIVVAGPGDAEEAGPGAFREKLASLVSGINLPSLSDVLRIVGLGTEEPKAHGFNGAAGILAQSVGGGGGVGGLNVTGVLTPFGSPTTIGVGGTGGDGGDGGDVTVIRGWVKNGATLTAAPSTISTQGDGDDGLVAQSIGGGGGNAGMNVVMGATAKADEASALLINVGGSGGGAGNGALVNVNALGDISTDGIGSTGLLAQSIGGGGGNEDFALSLLYAHNANTVTMNIGGAVGSGGSGGDVSVDYAGNVTTHQGESVAIEAQSIGGGGGSTFYGLALTGGAENELDLVLGQQGGSGGDGGNVSVTMSGQVITLDEGSIGILAQSIGGGGGISSSSGFDVSGEREADGNGYGAGVEIGINGGAGGVSGSVTVDASGLISTEGSESHGILAQSIGGGGGDGGSVGANDFAETATLGLTVGGVGATGALAGNVSVTTSAIIETQGERSDGVLAQSIGGGGGAGGLNHEFGVNDPLEKQTSSTVQLSVAIGGVGGGGGDSGSVGVTNTGQIFTKGERSAGIDAEAIGGGGGIGGGVVDITGLLSDTSSLAGGMRFGGVGGNGGVGGAVSVYNYGLISTTGDEAVGVIAVSIGGGGGEGGTVAQITLGASRAVTAANQTNTTFSLNIGGVGGDGGTSGNVTVVNAPTGSANTGVISTTGERAYGILAQSIAGGGGNGGSILSFTGMIAGNDSTNWGIDVGGFGGKGGDAGWVNVTNNGLIQTTGGGAHGILAQSIGGGGGDGGIVFDGAGTIGAGLLQSQASTLISVGGLGGDGGNGGDVTVTNTGKIVTTGENADGILAESIGGGGGIAQMSFGLSPSATSLILSSAVAGIVGGAGGGKGGRGGTVTVNQTGDIIVTGEGSLDFDAESINGGGGKMAFDFSGIVGLPGILVPDSPPVDPLIVAAAGASQATGASGGVLNVNATGNFTVVGDDGLGLFGQSVGGGGGTLHVKAVIAAPAGQSSPAGGAMHADVLTPAESSITGIGFQVALGGSDGQDNNGGAITSTHTGALVTEGTNTPGALVQSIGGGGGRADVDITVPAGALLGTLTATLGGSNGQNEAGGNVTTSHTGVIVTLGEISDGAIIQSIGGGGGDASIWVHGAGSAGTHVDAKLGSTGGTGLDGGDITATYVGGVETSGEKAIGLFLQSIGGGGGDVRTAGVDTIDVTLGGGQGNGGAIAFHNTGMIVTQGVGADGVFLQSVGGGGGAVFSSAAANVTLDNSGSGNGGAIQFTQTGVIITPSVNTFGVVAQSLGGGGGWVDDPFHGWAGGVGFGGAVSLTLDDVFSTNLNSTAVFAQSNGSLGGDDIVISSDGEMRGGSGTGAGVWIDGGKTNTLTTTGSISAVDGLAILGTNGGNLTIQDEGLLVGDVELTPGTTNTLHVAHGAEIIPFHTLALGGALTGLFVNDGELQMGLSAPMPPVFPVDLLNGGIFGNLDGMGDPRTNLLYGDRVIETVALNGGFTQTHQGHLDWEVAFGPYASDRINATGPVNVDGTGDVILTWLQDNHPVTIIATPMSAADHGLKIDSNLAVDFEVLAVSGTGVQLVPLTHFGKVAGANLNNNEQAIGGMMDSAVVAGNSVGLGRLLAYLGNMEHGDEALYKHLMTELNPEPLVAPLHNQLDEAYSFGDQLFTCDPIRGMVVHQCAWVSFQSADEFDKPSFQNFGVDRVTTDTRGGWQKPMEGPWSFNFAMGYEAVNRLSVDNGRANGHGGGGIIGAGFERRTDDNLALDVGITTGWSTIGMDRHQTVFVIGTGHSTINTEHLQLRADASKSWWAGPVFAKPSLGISITDLRMDHFAETGLGGLGWQTGGAGKVIAAFEPKLDFGVLLHDTPAAQALLDLSIGARVTSEDQLAAPLTLLGAGQGASPAVITTPYDNNAWTAGGRFTIKGSGPVTLGIDYGAEWGGTSMRQRGGLDIKVRW